MKTRQLRLFLCFILLSGLSSCSKCSDRPTEPEVDGSIDQKTMENSGDDPTGAKPQGAPSEPGMGTGTAPGGPSGDGVMPDDSVGGDSPDSYYDMGEPEPAEPIDE